MAFVTHAVTYPSGPGDVLECVVVSDKVTRGTHQGHLGSWMLPLNNKTSPTGKKSHSTRCEGIAAGALPYLSNNTCTTANLRFFRNWWFCIRGSRFAQNV